MTDFASCRKRKYLQNIIVKMSQGWDHHPKMIGSSMLLNSLVDMQRVESLEIHSIARGLGPPQSNRRQGSKNHFVAPSNGNGTSSLKYSHIHLDVNHILETIALINLFSCCMKVMSRRISRQS